MAVVLCPQCLDEVGHDPYRPDENDDGTAYDTCPCFECWHRDEYGEAVTGV